MKVCLESRNHIHLTKRDQLRHTTQAAHQAAEARWFTSGAFSSRASYLQWLTAMSNVHSKLGAVATNCTNLSAYRPIEVTRQDALFSDLGTNRLSAPPAKPKSAGWSWGVLYALHGSALGASMLLKTGAVKSKWPTHYLEEMRGFAVSGQLKKFFDDLNAASEPTIQMFDGANTVFNCLAAAK